MKDLTAHLEGLKSVTNVAEAQLLVGKMVEESMATKEKKAKSITDIYHLESIDKLTKFAYNFALSGEGLKVI